MTSRYIAIDWGSTNLRAWLYQGERCLESRQSEAGVMVYSFIIFGLLKR